MNVVTESLDLGNPVDRRHADRLAWRLSSVLLVVTLPVGLATAFVPDLLHGTAAMNGSARGTALVMATLGVCVALIGMLLARNSRPHLGRVLWAGALAYLSYNAVMLCFGTGFNALFLGYVAMLGLALFSLVATLAGTPYDDGWRASGTRPAAVYIFIVVALNTLAWSARIIPSLDEEHPDFLDGSGLTTNPVFVQDLAVWLPLMTVAGLMLWHGHAWGLLVGGTGLVFWQLEAVGVAVDQWFAHRADPASPVASEGGVWLFVGMFLAGLLPTLSVLRRLPARGRTEGAA